MPGVHRCGSTASAASGEGPVEKFASGTPDSIKLRINKGGLARAKHEASRVKGRSG